MPDWRPQVTATHPASDDNEHVDGVGNWRGDLARAARRITLARLGPITGGTITASVAFNARRITSARLAPAISGVLLGLLAVVETIVRADATHPAPVPILLLLAAFTTLPAGLLDEQPVVATLTVTAATVVSITPFRTLTVAGLAAQLIVLYLIGRRGSQILAAILAMSFLVVILAGQGGSSETWTLTVLLAALAPVAAWAGIAVRARTEAAEHSAAREVIAGSLLEHTARGERVRISRELHDVVAHHISMIAVQAESARLTTPGMPPSGAQKLSSIGDTARAALTEMRRLLGVLREDTRTDLPDRQPQPGLHQLNELLDLTRDATGTTARLIVRGWLTPLDPGVELAAYRIVQEALTNTRRHAPGAAVDVELNYSTDALRLRIRDNGPGPPPDLPEDGHGLAGMRERATAVGGELRIGAATGGGFLIEARLPAKAEAGT